MTIEFDDITDLICFRIAQRSCGIRDTLRAMYDRNISSEMLDYISLHMSKTVRELFFEAIEFADKLSEEKKGKIEISYKVEIDDPEAEEETKKAKI